MSEAVDPVPPPIHWIESLERSKAQIALGQTEPLLPVLDRLRVAAERLEAQMGVHSDEDGPVEPD